MERIRDFISGLVLDVEIGGDSGESDDKEVLDRVFECGVCFGVEDFREFHADWAWFTEVISMMLQ